MEEDIVVVLDNGGYGTFIGHYVYSVLTPPYDWRRDIDRVGQLQPITAALDDGLIGRIRAADSDLLQILAIDSALVNCRLQNDFIARLGSLER